MEKNPKRSKSKSKIQGNSGQSHYKNERAEKKETKLMDLIRRKLDACPIKHRAKIRKILDKMRQAQVPRGIPLVWSSPAQKALQNDLIIRLVFSHLDSASLLSSRLVCKLWENTATRQLLTRRHDNVFKIRFQWCRETKKYQHKNGKNLKYFYKTCGSNSKISDRARQFLCSQMKIVFKGGDLKSTLPDFFNKFGVSVRFLSLKPVCEQTKEFKSTLQSILMDLTPNLESLTFQSLGTYGQNIVEKPQGKKGLEKLRVLKLTHFERETKKSRDKRVLLQILLQLDDTVDQLQRILEERGPNPDDRRNPLITHARKIMELAPNLQFIQDPELIHTLHIVAAGKFHLIKSLDLKFPPDDSSLFEHFSSADPKLTRLNLIKNDRKTPGVGDIINLIWILHESQTTLEEFEGVEHLKSIFWTRLPGPVPVFPLVKRLHLAAPSVCSSDSRRILPDRFDLAHVFPNLVSLQFDQLYENAFNFSGAGIETGNGSASLQHLEFGVKRNFNPLWMDKISALYPNLTSLFVNIKTSKNFSLFPLVCQSIWTSLTQLEKLRLTVEVEAPSTQKNGTEAEKENKEKNVTEETDSVFTGFPLDFCRKLKEENSAAGMNTGVSLDKLREFPSLFDMKKLTEFKISCVKIHPGKLWSRVTEIHAFEKMKQQQNLRVEVTQRI